MTQVEKDCTLLYEVASTFVGVVPRGERSRQVCEIVVAWAGGHRRNSDNHRISRGAEHCRELIDGVSKDEIHACILDIMRTAASQGGFMPPPKIGQSHSH